MNIGIRLHDAAGSTMAERLCNIEKQGFSCAHIAMAFNWQGYSVANAAEVLNDDTAAQMKELLATYHQQCAVLGCYLNLGTPDEEELERSINCYKANLRFAPKVGALVVGTETGNLNTGYKPDEASQSEEALELFIRRVTPLVRYAEEQGACLALEPVTRHIVSSAERAQRVLERIKSDNLKIILDAVNLLTSDNEQQADAVIADAISRLGDKIEVLHMKDYRVIPGQKNLEELACGLVGMDYHRLLSFARSREGMPMTLEFTKPDNAEQARLHLENYR